VAEKLNGMSSEVSAVRADADRSMRDSIDAVNALLSQFKVVNDSIVRGQGSPDDLSDSLDQRDSILKLLSEELGIRTVTRPNNDMLIYAEGGAVLFEGSPRSVTMAPAAIFDAMVQGETLYIDGIAVTGPSASMRLVGGRLAALGNVRDTLAPKFQDQIDLISGALIRNFGETDRSEPPGLPDVAGLFVGGTGVLPEPGEIVRGLAARITLNALADPQHGGSVLLLRDGGFGGSAYVANTQGVSSFQARVGELVDSFDKLSDFGGGAGIGGMTSLKGLGAQSSAWVEVMRQSAQQESDLASASRVRTNESLLRVTGVNIDQEMAILLDLEKSYQASSKVISIVDAMLATLMEAVR
jgi:flagellar hook-associated protein 1 FlgK